MTAVAVTAALLATGVGVAVAESDRVPAVSASPAAASTVSPVFGINMSLYDGSDELATDPGTQAMMKSWGVPLIRVPLRAGLTDAVLVRALRAVLVVGATPMVILRGPKSGTLADNQHLLDLVHGVFGDRRVYLEYGNEQDLAGVTAAGYVAGWNATVPALKRAAPTTYQFVGPVNFRADPGYAAAFVRGAQPQPDYLSWHEYVCAGSNADSYCTGHIANWTTHAHDVESAVRTAVGHPIPFFISEWNLDPSDESRYANASFIQPWTRAALTELLGLVPDGLAGAMVYTATNHGDFGLVNGGAVTPQGAVFRDVLAAYAPASSSPVASSSAAATGSAAPDPSASGSAAGSPAGGGAASGSGSSGDSRGSSSGGGSSGGGGSGGTAGTATASAARVGFEDGYDGWDEYWGYDSLTLSRTTSVHYEGSYALKMTTSSTNYVAGGTESVGGLKAGDTVTFHVYASGSGGNVRPFVMDPASAAHWGASQTNLPSSAGWFTLSFTVPSGFSVHAIGLQLKSASAGGWIALDGLNWPG
jgi:uncharacterized membrane protein YgcG